MAETNLSHKADIMARCMTEVHTKEVRSRVDVFQMARSVLSSSPAFAFPFFAKQLTARGQGQALSCSYI